MTRIEKIISLYTALTGDATVTPVEVNKYAGLSESVSLEAISATITADSPINFGAMPVNDLLNYLFVNLFGKTQAEVDALRATTEGAAGFQYWADELANNPQVINLNTLAIALLNGAEAAEANGNGTDATNAAKKVEGSVADYNAAYPDSGNPSETEGQTFTMTDGRDTIIGTAGNDTINAFVGQNQNGALANAFATGDYIDGGAGTDTLFATLMNDNEVDSGTNFDINVRTKNVEIAKFEVLDEGVVVDAGTMDSVKEFWSVNSDDSGLTLEDVRLGSKLQITKDITFGMKDVDYGSDLTARLDSNSFKNSGEKKFNSKIVVEVGDSNKDAGSTNPLELIKLTLEFTFDGQDYKFEDMTSVDGTYEGLKAAITTALSDKGLSNLVVSFGNSLTEIVAKNDTVDLLYSGAKQIIITDPNGAAFTNFKSGVSAKASEESSNPVSNTSAQDPNQSSTLIESNLILDNAGRGSTAGDVVIGAMSNSNAGIEQFNVTVQGTNGSAIQSLKTTNDKLQNIIIKSATDSTASLEIGATQANLKLIDASGFKGTNLMLGTTVEAGRAGLDEDTSTVTVADVLNLKTLNANIASNVTFHADVQAGANYTYTTGTGNDTIKVKVDGDAVDTIGEGLAINAGNGDNTVTVDMQGGKVSVGTTADLNNLSITTGSGVDKVTLIGGRTGVTDDGDADFNISTGAGSDFVHINSMSDAASSGMQAQVSTVTLSSFDAGDTITIGGVATADVSVTSSVDIATTVNALVAAINGAAGATVTASNVGGVLTLTAKVAGTGFTPTANVADADTDSNVTVATVATPTANVNAPKAATGTWTVGTTTGASAKQVLYKAELTVNFAGFEQTVTINTTAANNFIATQVEINEAIQAAIKANPELARLLTTELGTGTQAMTIKSTVEGANELLVSIVQPNHADAVIDAMSSIELNAIKAGLIATGEAADSAAVDTSTKITTLLNNNDTATVTGTGTNGGSANETAVTNVSVIDLGKGANDLVVLNSDVDSVNTIKFSASWDKVSVVNFESIGDIANAGVTGKHKLDFTAFLGNQTDASANTNALSAVTIATDVITAAGAVDANSVVVTTFTAFNALDGATTLNFNSMTDAQVLAELNATGGYTVGATANLVGAIQKSMLMIENVDNLGEYKVYEVTSTNTAGENFTAATLVGTIDFGDTVLLANANLA